MTVTTPSDGEAGFTLIEVLVALALVSVLAATIAMATSQFGSLLRIDRQLESRLALQRVVSHMANLLEDTHGTAPLTAQDGQSEPGKPVSIVLKGTKSEVRFLAVARRGAYLRGFRDVTLYLEGATKDLILFQDMAPRRLGAISREDIEHIELARNVTVLTFSYYGVQGESAEPAWQENWSNSTTLPTAISISLSVRQKDAILTATDVAYLGTP